MNETQPMTLREIDVLVAERVMGWTCIGEVWTYPDETGPSVDAAIHSGLVRPAEGWTAKHVAGLSPAAAKLDATASPNEPRVNGASVHSLEIVPSYTSDIAAAWQVVERMRAEFGVRLSVDPTGRASVEMASWQKPERFAYADDADTPAMAICLAALRAHGVDVTPAE